MIALLALFAVSLIGDFFYRMCFVFGKGRGRGWKFSPDINSLFDIIERKLGIFELIIANLIKWIQIFFSNFEKAYCMNFSTNATVYCKNFFIRRFCTSNTASSDFLILFYSYRKERKLNSSV